MIARAHEPGVAGVWLVAAEQVSEQAAGLEVLRFFRRTKRQE
jgi:hypothetical protein